MKDRDKKHDDKKHRVIKDYARKTGMTVEELDAAIKELEEKNASMTEWPDPETLNY